MEAINGKVRISHEILLKEAKQAYTNYRAAFWREVFQNSIDAGASTIDVTWDEDARTITAIDNGCGMDLDTLLNVFLAYGGTKKPDGATGGFGEAKKLEAFAWPYYELHTKNLLLSGSGDSYTITETQDNLDGCRITITIPEDENFEYITRYAKIVAQKIETDCQIIVDGEIVSCTVPKGNFVKSLNVGDIYVNEDLPASSYANVRINGIWMFEQYISNDAPHITLELSSESIECLNSNRDGLKGSYLQDAQEYFTRLAADRRSALFPDKEEIRLHAMGTDGRKYQITDDDMEFLEKLHGHGSKQEFREGLVEFIMNNSPEMLQKLVEMRASLLDTDGYDPDEYAKLKYFGFRWDTVHKFEKGQEREARKFLDGSEQNARRARTILEIWGETLKQVMLDTNQFHEFSIGFTWNEDAQAQIERKDGNTCFFLNPKLLLEKYNLKNREMLGKKIRQMAVHEVTHFQREYHDELFMSTMEEFMEMTWRSEKLYDRISRIVVR